MNYTFPLDTSIYSRENIIQAISDFSDIAPLKFEDEILTIDCDTQEESIEIWKEYMNYIIGLMQQ
jgi:hypothetical protein